MSRTLQSLIAMLLAGLWGGGIYVLHAQGRLRPLDRVESAITDFRTALRGVRAPPDIITIVEIDDAAVKQLGSYPLARSDLARIIDAIGRLKPKVVAVDILLLDPSSAEGDEALARSLGAYPCVIAAAAIFAEFSQPISGQSRQKPLAGLPQAERFLWPLEKFADRAAVGIVNMTTDQSGTPRRVPMLFRTHDLIAMSFPLRVASLAVGREPTVTPDRLLLGELSIPTDAEQSLPITFYGPRGTIRTVSTGEILAGAINPAAIENKVVVIGAAVAGGGDFFPTPFESLLPGAEVMATAIAHLMTADVVRHDRMVRNVDGLICVALPVVLVGLIGWRRSAVGLVAAAAVVVIWLSTTSLSFSAGVWLSAALPVAAAAPPAILFAAVQIWSGRRLAQHLATKSRLLEEFQAPGVQQWLSANPDFLAKPVRQPAAIVFIDLSGFTGVSEAVGPDRVRELLKDFHGLVDKEAVTCRGTITSFQGDGAMILFGLPEPAPDDAFRAVDCAVRLSAAASAWLTSLPAPISSRLGYKLGAHFGTIVASRLGGRSHHHITATGDTVNVASRLMEVAADHHVELAVSDELLTAAGRNGAVFKSGALTGPRDERIRGRSGTLAVWLWRSESRAVSARRGEAN